LQQNNRKFSLKRELLRKRTVLSLLFSLFLVYLFLSRTTFSDMVHHLTNVNPLFLVLAFLSHYTAYLFRGYRWRTMIRQGGFSGTTLDLAKIIFLFQSIDCVLPAKLGDLYGAHLMKLNFSLSRSFSLGSIFLWRIFDFSVVMAFAVTAAVFLFGSRIPPELLLAIKVAVPSLLALLALMGLFFHYHRWLPLRFRSERLKGLIDSFRRGLKLNGKIVPSLLVTTCLIWLLEAGRFFFVCKSMAVEIDVVSVLFVTFCTVFLTAIPFTPSGLGAVEFGMLELLALVGVASSAAYPLIIWDRLIAHWSQIVLGMVLALFSRAVNLKIWHFEEEGVSSSTKSLAPS